MICPKCNSTENIKFFVRHQKTDENDNSQVANAITMLHADPECGYNETFMLEDCLDYIFTEWSELQPLAEKLNNIENNINGLSSVFASMADMASEDMIETEGEVVEDCALPPVQEETEIENE